MTAVQDLRHVTTAVVMAWGVPLGLYCAFRPVTYYPFVDNRWLWSEDSNPLTGRIWTIRRAFRKQALHSDCAKVELVIPETMERHRGVIGEPTIVSALYGAAMVFDGPRRYLLLRIGEYGPTLDYPDSPLSYQAIQYPIVPDYS